MSSKKLIQLHEDKLFLHEAQRFRKYADNVPTLRKRLVKLGYKDQACLLDQLRWLKEPDKLIAVDAPDRAPINIFGGGQISRQPFNFGTIPDKPVDAVSWLTNLGALRLDNHFQCHWAACTIVIAVNGWRDDKITRRGRRWVYQPPDLPRASFLLHWKDHRDVFNDWKRHMARLCIVAATLYKIT
jgi:hypothetical protein